MRTRLSGRWVRPPISSWDRAGSRHVWQAFLVSLSRRLFKVCMNFNQSYRHGDKPPILLPDFFILKSNLEAIVSIKHDILRSEESTSELQSLMISTHADYCLQKKKHRT